MQTQPSIQRYDRSLIVRHISYDEIEYRRSYELPMTPDDALKQLIKLTGSNIQNTNALKSKVKQFLIKKKNTEFLDYLILTKSNEELQIKGYSFIPFDQPIELPLDLIITMAKEDPYLGLCAGEILASLIDKFEISAYNESYFGSREFLEEQVNDADDKTEFKEHIKLEYDLFKNLQKLMQRCQRDFYINKEFKNHPFVILMNKIKQTLGDSELKTYESFNQLKEDAEKEIIHTFYSKQEEESTSSMNLCMTYYPSFKNHFHGVTMYQEFATNHVVEGGYFAGIIIEEEKMKETIDLLDSLNYFYNSLLEFYKFNEILPWKSLSSLTNILSFTKMDTLKEGTLCIKRKKAPLARRTLSEIMS
jgi:hypothetical protein